MLKKLLPLFAAPLLACGTQTFIAAAFVETPSVPNPRDPAHPLPPFAMMTAYLGTIDTTNPTQIDSSKVKPLSGATATVEFHSVRKNADRLLTFPADSGGTYSLNSNQESKLTFEPGVKYTLVVETPGADREAFGASFQPGPPPVIQEFQASKLLDNHAQGADLTLTRTDAPDSDGRYTPAFVIVGQVDPNNPTAQPNVVYTTVPQQAPDLLKLALSDAPYRVKTFTVPGARAFASSGYFVVALLSVAQGKVSGNAFIGSTALAGTGDAGVVHVP